MTVASQSLRLAEITFASNQGFRYVSTAGGFRVCSRCCGTCRNNFAVDPRWIIKADHVNRTSYPLTCDNCGGCILSK